MPPCSRALISHTRSKWARPLEDRLQIGAIRLRSQMRHFRVDQRPKNSNPLLDAVFRFRRKTQSKRVRQRGAEIERGSRKELHATFARQAQQILRPVVARERHPDRKPTVWHLKSSVGREVSVDRLSHG